MDREGRGVDRLRRHRDDGAVNAAEHVEVGGGLLDQVLAVEVRRTHDGDDLAAQRGEVLVQRGLRFGVEAGLARLHGLGLHLDQEVGDGGGAVDGHVHRGRAQAQRRLDRGDAGDFAAQVLGDRKCGGIVLRPIDLQASGDAQLRRLQLARRLVKRLQRKQLAHVGVH